MKILLISFLIVNIATFSIAGYDKYLATKNKWRISEKTLFTAAAFGGSVGLFLAMLIFRHKTSKSSFIIKFTLIFSIQILLVILKLTNKI